jgi:hypothetical protein
VLRGLVIKKIFKNFLISSSVKITILGYQIPGSGSGSVSGKRVEEYEQEE